MKIAMPSKVHNGLGLMLLACVLVVLLLRFAWKKRQRIPKSLPITRARLLWLACGRALLLLCVCLLSLWAYFVLAFCFGVMGADGLAGGVALSLIVVGLCLAGPAFRIWACTRLIWNRSVDINALLTGKVLERQDGVWRYRDEKWYICIGGGCCAVLCAPLIDFGQPEQIGTDNPHPWMRTRILIRFASKDGGRFHAQHVRSDEIRLWTQERRREIRREKRNQIRIGKQKGNTGRSAG